MTRIVHISDLHFGRTDADLLQPLLAAVNDARPDLVAVTGDLTQRARVSQFRAARQFLDGIAAPWRAVPGNHDIPLDNLALRMLWPFARYRAQICPNLTPDFAAPGLTVQGFNTVDPFRWQRGRVRARDLDAACARFAPAQGHRVVMAHHPFEQGRDSHKALMKHAPRSVALLAGCGVDVVLSGHLHRWRAAPLTAANGWQMVQVHVGTGLSTRLRGQENDFAILDLDGACITLTRMVARNGAFRAGGEWQFHRGPNGWESG
ncbi:3',5'-cyclic-nucleotide phosphodiesterase (plasmid) [Rhodovulum sp. P5]|uniref:metallophosphoesterase family protein n=1 Tax=Rhodovulum sp. P5 TaxID=1564506 RepID=UPI0009C2DBBF|nr:metallophosphoesterase [Rhodovulum sp. P5]ARE42322.1 3',5'-cyclic-nucleotide phosphodiesterase [Rhodovulum sp. P5]